MKFRLLLTSSIILLFIIALTTSAPISDRRGITNNKIEELSIPVVEDTSVATASSTCPPKHSCYANWQQLLRDVGIDYNVVHLPSCTVLSNEFLYALNRNFEGVSERTSFNILMKISFSRYFVNQKIKFNDRYCENTSNVSDLFSCLGKKLKKLQGAVKNGEEKSVLVIGSTESSKPEPITVGSSKQKENYEERYSRLHIFVEADKDNQKKDTKCIIMYFVESEKEESEKEEFEKIMEPYVQKLKVCKETTFKKIGHFRKQSDSPNTDLQMMSKLEQAFLEAVSPPGYVPPSYVKKEGEEWLENFKNSIARSSIKGKFELPLWGYFCIPFMYCFMCLCGAPQGGNDPMNTTLVFGCGCGGSG